ncbi:MAG TPA: exodeoxyribonuclease V subunit gamma, partial [Acidimicrobiales bacterium]|nr:exodeoxyribonuclease V subunit gamma [Acidimicrobiales bacterium]
MLHVHRSERADHLVEALGELLLQPSDDPMAPDVVAVPTRGVERWLTQRLSHRLGASPGRTDGVCANVVFPFPGFLVGKATAAACGFAPEVDPWPPERSVWPLLELVDSHLGEDWLEPLAAHLRKASAEPSGGPGSPPRRFATMRHLADLYDRYAVHRPDMVRRWVDGDDAGVPADSSWQPELWRRLRRRIDVPSPAERYVTAAEVLAERPELLDLPSRLSLFGLTRLPASHLLVLQAVARGRDVHLFLLHPSGEMWRRVADHLAGAPPVLAREEDETRRLPVNPLLRSWGRDAREMQLVLSAQGVAGGTHRPVPDGAPTLLGRIQSDVRADRSPSGPPAGGEDRRPLLAGDDDSLVLHSCHGRARQVEVVRDAVLHLLAEDPTLEPRDVIVMCPDIEAFAPLVHAAFGSPHGADTDEDDPVGADDDGLPRLRVRLADRALRQTNPLLAVAARLLELAGGRLTASDVVDLASREPVARRFRLDEEDLTQIEKWVAGTGVRWGLDAAHRAPWRLESLGANTWAAGLDRLLLGVAMTEEDHRLFGGVLPLDDVAGSDVDLAGRLAELVGRLGAGLDGLVGPLAVADWGARLVQATEWLAEAAPADSWQHEQLHRVLDEVVLESAGGRARPEPSGALLDLGEVRALLAQRLQGRPTRANFR